MAIFAVGGPAYQKTAVPNSATLVFNTAASGIPTGVVLRDVTLVNAGTVNVFVGGSAVTTTTGLLVAPGQQVTVTGYSHAQGDTAGNVYAIASAATGGFVEAGLATDSTVD